MKKNLFTLTLVLMMSVFIALGALAGCDKEKDSIYKNKPFDGVTLGPSQTLVKPEAEDLEKVFDDNFDNANINSMPSNWKLYSDANYKTTSQSARIVAGEEGNRYVKLTSTGLNYPPYPAGDPVPSFNFTREFNLDASKKGVAYASLMVPSVKIEELGKQTEGDVINNEVTFSVASGSVNVISVTITKSYKLVVKRGGLFYYYTNKNVAVYEDLGAYSTVSPDTWYTFKLEWDAAQNMVRASIKVGESFVKLVEGTFHESNRFLAEPQGNIIVPNVVSIRMPKKADGGGGTYTYFADGGYKTHNGAYGEAYLDNVKVERMV